MGRLDPVNPVWGLSRLLAHPVHHAEHPLPENTMERPTRQEPQSASHPTRDDAAGPDTDRTLDRDTPAAPDSAPSKAHGDELEKIIPRTTDSE